MNEKEIAFETIVNDIKEQEDLISNQIKNEVKYSYEDQITSFKNSLKKDLEIYYEKEMTNLKVLSTTENSKLKLKMKKQLLSLRQNLVDKLFNDVLNRLKDFTNSNEYEKYIQEKLNSIANLSDDSIILVSKKDLEIFNKICGNKKIEEANILIGGFRIIDNLKKVEYDFTLDTRLKEEKQYFQNNSGFTI